MQKPLSSLIHQSPNLHLAKMQFEKKLRQHLRIRGGAAADQVRNGAVTSLGTFCSIETIICFLMQCFFYSSRASTVEVIHVTLKGKISSACQNLLFAYIGDANFDLN